MASDKKTIRSVRTLSQLLDRRRTRTASGAFLELSALANERARLRRELERWERRQQEIMGRLAEIQEKEQMLAAIVQTEMPPLSPSGSNQEPMKAAAVSRPRAASEPTYEIDGRFETKEFEY